MIPQPPEPDSEPSSASPLGAADGDSTSGGASSADKNRAADEIFAGWMTKRAPAERTTAAQDAATLEALCSRHPDHAGELRELHTQWRRVNSILDRLGGQPTVSQRLRTRFGQSVDPGISLHGDDGEGAPGAATNRLLERLSSNRAASSRYRMRGELGRGGMGIVYDVWDEDLRRTLAMKVVLGKRDPSGETTKVQVDPRRMSRFLEEAQITGQLDHPSILPIHELGLDKDGRVYFTMQRVEGRDLREVFGLSREGKEGWTQARVLDVLIKVCEATAFAHSKGVIHRDLKPANVMVGKFGATYLMDWGLAKVLGREESRDLRLRPADGGVGKEAEPQVATDRSSSDSVDDALATMDGDIVGTPAYMPPEQANAQVENIGPHSDVYSAGAMLYHLLTGQMPYEPLGERVPAYTILNAVRTSEPWPIEDITPAAPPELVAICKKSMAREIGDRYRDMTELAEELRNYRDGRPVAAYDTGLAEEVRKWVQRNKPLAAMAAALAVVLIGGIVAFVAQQRTQLRKLEEEQFATQSAREEAEASFLDAEEQRQLAEAQKGKAEIAAEAAQREKNNALINSQVALEKADEAERKGYLAHLVAADFSLQLGNAGEALIHLGECPPERRQFEWQHLWAKTNTYVTEVRSGNLSDAFFLALGMCFAALPGDGSTLITVEGDRRLTDQDFIRLFDAETGERRRRLRVASLPLGVMGELPTGEQDSFAAVSPDGQFLIASLRGGAPRLWSLAARTKPKTFEDHELVYLAAGSPSSDHGLKGEKTEASGQATSSLSLSLDGMIVAAGLDSGDVFLWERSNRVPFLRIPAGGEDVSATALAFSPDGKNLVIGYDSGLCRVHSIEAGGSELIDLRGDESEVTDLAWSPNGLEIASVSDAGALRLWSAVNGEPLWVLLEHEAAVNSVAYHPSPNRKLLATASDDGTIRLWNTDSGRVLNAVGAHSGRVLHVGFDAAGERLVSSSSDGDARVWDLADLEGTTTFVHAMKSDFSTGPVRVGRTQFSADGTRLLSVELQTAHLSFDGLNSGEKRERGQVVIRRSLDHVILHQLEPEGPPLVDATWCGSNGEFVVALQDGGGREFKSENGEVESGGLLLFDAQTGAFLRRLNSAHEKTVNLLSAPPTGSVFLASAGADRAVHLIDTGTGRVVHRLGDHGGGVYSIAFSNDGQRLASVGRSRVIHIWSVEDGALLQAIDTQLKWRVKYLAFDPNSDRLAGAYSKEVRFWSTETGEELMGGALSGHDLFVTSILFHPDEPRFVTTSLDGAVKVWDLAAGEELLVLDRGGRATGGSFHPDGSRLAVGKYDGTTQVFETKTAAERRPARRSSSEQSEEAEEAEQDR